MFMDFRELQLAEGEAQRAVEHEASEAPQQQEVGKHCSRKCRWWKPKWLCERLDKLNWASCQCGTPCSFRLDSVFFFWFAGLYLYIYIDNI